MYLSTLALCCGRSRRQKDADDSSPGPNPTTRLPRLSVPGETNDQQILHEAPLSKAARRSKAAETPNFLEAFPVELVQHVIRFLAPDSRALMALASKLCMTMCGGTDCMRVSKKYLGPFLLALERDFVDRACCRGCGTLHHQSTLVKAQWPDDMRCFGSCHQWNRRLPPMLRHDVVRLIMRQYRRKRDYSHLLGAVATNKSGWLLREGCKSVIECRIINDCLLFRSSHFLCPVGGTWDDRDSSKIIRRNFHSRSFWNFCNHKSWHQEYPFLSADPEFPGIKATTQKAHHSSTSQSSEQTSVIDNITKLRCALQHSQPCKSCHLDLGEVRCCHLCHTDYTFNVVDLEEVGRVLVLTTWRDLGQGLTMWDPKWSSHFQRHCRKNIAFKRADSPDVYRAFEPVSIGSKGTMAYSPVITGDVYKILRH